MFQCPTSGLSHFYIPKNIEHITITRLFQCPTSGLSHFYDYRGYTNRCFPEAFQCPTSGLSHFYENKEGEVVMEKNVSMPYIGLIPFLRIPSQHPIKSAFPGLILGGISQNILKIMIFHLKNGMFTICSYFYCNTTIFFLLKQVFFHILSLLSQQKITVHWCPVNSNSKNAAVQAPPNFYDIQPFKIACADGPYTREHGFYLKGTMSHGQSGERADLSELSRKNLRSLQVHIQSPF